jgi:hypothetical protein
MRLLFVLSISYGIPTLLPILLLLPPLTAILSVGLLAGSILAWKDRYWSKGGRLHYSLLTVVVLAFTLWLYYWNLFGFWY